MKVVLLAFHFGEYTIRLASALSKRADVLLLLSHQQAEHWLGVLDPTVYFQAFHQPRLRQPVRQMGMIAQIIRHIKDFDPDVIHLQNGHLWFNLALPLVKRYPLVITIHDPKPHLGDKESGKRPALMRIWDFGHHRADQLIVHGKRLRQDVIEDLGFSRNIINVVPMIALGDGDAPRLVQENGHQILFFGRIWPYKGLEYLIRAEPIISTQVPDVKIVIAGKGDDFSQYRRLMVHPEQFVVYNEYIPDKDCARLFQQSSVVALPYIDASQSAVIPMAYTFGKPVVATSVGGLPELVDHGQTGYLVPPQDERALAEALICLLQDKNLRQQMGENGKYKVETELSPDAVARQTLSVYHQAIVAKQGVSG